MMRDARWRWRKRVFDAAEARLAQRDETLRSGGGAAAGNAFVLRAPISGRIAEVSATLGASYDEGTPLFKIVRTDRVELQAQVPPADAAMSRDIVGIAFEIPGLPDPVQLEPHHVHDAGVIDPTTRALPVQIEVDNPGGRLLVGQTGTAVLYQRGLQRVPAVPKLRFCWRRGGRTCSSKAAASDSPADTSRSSRATETGSASRAV